MKWHYRMSETLCRRWGLMHPRNIVDFGSIYAVVPKNQTYMIFSNDFNKLIIINLLLTLLIISGTVNLQRVFGLQVGN